MKDLRTSRYKFIGTSAPTTIYRLAIESHESIAEVIEKVNNQARNDFATHNPMTYTMAPNYVIVVDWVKEKIVYTEVKPIPVPFIGTDAPFMQTEEEQKQKEQKSPNPKVLLL